MRRLSDTGVSGERCVLVLRSRDLRRCELVPVVLGAALVYGESDWVAFVVLFRLSSGGKDPPTGAAASTACTSVCLWYPLQGWSVISAATMRYPRYMLRKWVSGRLYLTLANDTSISTKASPSALVQA